MPHEPWEVLELQNKEKNHYKIKIRKRLNT